MDTMTAVGHGIDPKPLRGRRARAFYTSRAIAAAADHAGSVSVDVSIAPGMVDLDLVTHAIVASAERGRLPRTSAAVTAEAIRGAFKVAVTEVFKDRFTLEIGKVVDAYRVMLRESLAKGEDPDLQAALNRARLQEKILASTSMVDQAQGCQLLGRSDANPSATMKRKEDKQEILRFTIDGRAVYPLFQFDVEGRRIAPEIAQLIARKPASWSDFRLLHWLMRPHLDFDGTPAEALGADPDAVLAAFDREVEPEVQG